MLGELAIKRQVRLLLEPPSMRSVWLSTLICAIGCSSSAVDVPVANGGQLVHDGNWGGSPSPQIYVLVVDDSAGGDADELRLRIADGVRRALLRHVQDSWGYCGSKDPAEWRPTDHRIVIVRPSAPDESAIVSWIDEATQWWSSTNTVESEVAGIADPLYDTMGSRPALVGELHRPLRAAARTLALLAKTRAPATESEQKLVDSLPESPLVNLVVASTRDDEEDAPIESYVLDEQHFPYVIKWVIGPFDPELAPCPSPSVAATRLGAWGKLVGAVLESQRCPQIQNLDLGHGVADCHGWCIPARPLVLPNGSASCRISISQPDLTQCDASRGWTDPLAGIEFIEDGGQTLRLCDVVQLEGLALDFCRHDINCPGCPAGFCVTEVAELIDPVSCEKSELPEPFRFIRDSFADVWTSHIVCDLSP